MTVFKEHVATWKPFGTGFYFCEFDAAPSDGPLRPIHQPTVTRARGRLLISLSVSSGVAPTTVEDTLGRAIEELLDGAREGDTEELVVALQQDTWRLFQAGRFDRAVPDIMVVVSGAGGDLRSWRAGPNGVAMADNDGVRLLSEDLRLAALRRLGASLENSWLQNPLLAEVSDLTQIEPPVASNPALDVDLRDGCLLLMSRGAVPFAAPSDPEASTAWWNRDAGWRHGLGATVVAIARERSQTLGVDVLSALALAIREAVMNLPEGRAREGDTCL